MHIFFCQQLCNFTLEWHQRSWAGATRSWQFVCILFVNWSWNICPPEQCLWRPYFQKTIWEQELPRGPPQSQLRLRLSHVSVIFFSSLSSLPELRSSSVSPVLYLTRFPFDGFERPLILGLTVHLKVTFECLWTSSFQSLTAPQVGFLILSHQFLKIFQTIPFSL